VEQDISERFAALPAGGCASVLFCDVQCVHLYSPSFGTAKAPSGEGRFCAESMYAAAAYATLCFALPSPYAFICLEEDALCLHAWYLKTGAVTYHYKTGQND